MYPKAVRPAPLAALILLLPLLLSGCSDSGTTSPTILPGAPFSTTDVIVGTGAEAATGRSVTVTYTGWIYDPSKPQNRGAQFDSNVGGTPLPLTLGAQQVIPGFDRGVTGMKVGGERVVVVPPDLAYGSQGTQDGKIPPYATLVFDIRLLSVQ